MALDPDRGLQPGPEPLGLQAPPRVEELGVQLVALAAAAGDERVDPDALVAATAIVSNSTALITNDKALARLGAHIEVVVLDDLLDS